MLIGCDAKVKNFTQPIGVYVKRISSANATQTGSHILVALNNVTAQLKSSLTDIQALGTDATPLSPDGGVTVSDISWSAFQIVLTLKTVFQSVTGLYKPFPVIKQTCGDALLTVSTALASLIGACGEQVNLFDTRFFPLVTPQLQEFKDIPDNFFSFVGSFAS